MTEEFIIAGCLHNDPSAQRELYNRFSPKMLSVCYRFAQSREDAEDMLQEGFIKVFTQIHTFQNKGAFEGWIRRIIVHTCINFLKKYKKFNDSVDLGTGWVCLYKRRNNSFYYAGKTGNRMYYDCYQ